MNGAQRLLTMQRSEALSGSRIDRDTDAPSFMLPISWCTAIYMFAQVGVCALAMDVAAGWIPAQVDVVFVLGRIVSGSGLSLALLGRSILPVLWRRTSVPWHRAGVTIAVTAACLLVAWVGETGLVSYGVLTSSVAERRAANQAVSLAAGDSRERGLGIALDLPDGMVDAPPGKSFLALLPLVATENTFAKGSLDTAITRLAHERAIDRIGRPEDAYNSSFIPSVRFLKESFNHYAAAQQVLSQNVSLLASDAATAWSVCRTAGPPGCQSAGKKAFIEDFATAARARDDNEFTSKMVSSFGSPIATGLSWDQFVALPSVQAKWRLELNAPRDALLVPSMGFDAFKKAVWLPRDRFVEEEFTEGFHTPPELFADGGSHAAAGLSAVRLIAIPGLVLFLSVFGLLLHAYLLAGYMATVLQPRFGTCRLARTFTLWIALSVFMLPSQISSSIAVGGIIGGAAFPASGATVSWIVRAAPALHWIGEPVAMFYRTVFAT